MRTICLSGVFLSLIAAMSLNVYAADDVSSNRAGAGIIVSTSPYRGVGNKVLPLPFFSWEYKRFYVRGIEVGCVLFERSGWEISAITAPRMMGYSSADSDALDGMEDRLQSWDGGLKAKWNVPGVKGWSLQAQIVNDLLSRYDGREAVLRLEQSGLMKYAHIITALGVRIQSSQMTHYYYGVQGSEAAAGRSAYEPETAINPFVSLTASTRLSERWIVLARTDYTWLDSTISHSPIVENNYTLAGVLGVMRKF